MKDSERDIIIDWLLEYKKAMDSIRYTLDDIEMQKARMEDISSSLSFDMGWTGKLNKAGEKIMAPILRDKNSHAIKDNTGTLDDLFKYTSSFNEQVEKARAMYLQKCKIMQKYISNPDDIMALRYRYFMSCTNAEVADKLGTSTDQITRFINRGLDSLSYAINDPEF